MKRWHKVEMGEPAKGAPIHVSDHALFCWLDRAGVIDVPALRAGLATALDRAYQASAALGVGEVLILSNGLVYIVRGGVLITVLHDDGRHDHARRFVHPASSAASDPELGPESGPADPA